MIVTDKQDGIGVRLFRVCDDDNGCDDEFDTLEEALKYAEEQVKAYRDAAYFDGEWCGSERVDVYRVIKRWSLQPVTGPNGETHDENGYEYMDLVEEELPPVLTLDVVEKVARWHFSGMIASPEAAERETAVFMHRLRQEMGVKDE